MSEPREPMGDDLLDRCARRDPAAYRELVERLEKPLLSFILRFVGERHVAEDLFQETFVRVVRTIEQSQPLKRRGSSRLVRLR